MTKEELQTQAKWDKKAQTFPRFKKDTQDTLEVLEFFESCGASLKDKVVFDIGCGNGRFALQIAFEAKKVYCSDISSLMLSNLEEDAQKHGLTNITTLHGSWMDFDLKSLKDKIDFGFASMTPALNHKAGFLKALEVGESGLCFVGWGRNRRCHFLDEIMQQHNITLLLPLGLPNALEWLEEENYPKPSHKYMESNFVYNATSTQAIEDIKWNIAMHEGVPNMDLIHAYVKKHEKNGEISYKHSREIGIAYIPRI